MLARCVGHGSEQGQGWLHTLKLQGQQHAAGHRAALSRYGVGDWWTQACRWLFPSSTFSAVKPLRPILTVPKADAPRHSQ